MALKILYTKINGLLTADISAATTLIPVDADTLSNVTANLNFGAGDWTYLTITNDIYSEEVKVINTQTTYLVVTRAQSGSTAKTFSAVDTVLYDHFGAQAIQDLIAATPATVDVNVVGQGLVTTQASTSGGVTTYIATVTPPNFTGSDGISIQGVWPNLNFAYEGAGDSGCCGGGGGTSGSGVNQVVVVSSILQASISAETLTLTLPSPSFQGTGGVTVSGSWADGYTITGGGGGGTGTVTTVNAGTGLSLTGSPNTNPTLSISNTGVAAGAYGGFTFNAQGQLTGVTGGYAPVGSLTLTNGGSATLSGTAYTITLNNADVGVEGIVALADSSAAPNPADDSTAVTPKMLVQALAGAGSTLLGAGSSNGEADALYNNAVSTTAVTLNTTASQKILIVAEVEAVDASTPLTPVAFGVAVFASSGVKLYGSKIVTQNKQVMVFVLSGAYSTNIAVTTTALPSGASITSANLAAIIF
jgi:hypothetical protein